MADVAGEAGEVDDAGEVADASSLGTVGAISMLPQVPASRASGVGLRARPLRVVGDLSVAGPGCPQLFSHLEVRVITEAGELLRHLTIDPTRPLALWTNLGLVRDIPRQPSGMSRDTTAAPLAGLAPATHCLEGSPGVRTHQHENAKEQLRRHIHSSPGAAESTLYRPVMARQWHANGTAGGPSRPADHPVGERPGASVVSPRA